MVLNLHVGYSGWYVGEEAKSEDNACPSLNGMLPGMGVGEGAGPSTVPESPSSLPENARSPYATLANWSSVTGEGRYLANQLTNE